jgi:hypothetical protein
VSTSSDPDLIKVTEIFLVPSSFLVAALGTADTNFHRSAVSLLGLIISSLWWICSREAMAERVQTGPSRHPLRTRILSWLAIVFVIGWLVSVVIHTYLWNQPLGKDAP